MEEPEISLSDQETNEIEVLERRPLEKKESKRASVPPLREEQELRVVPEDFGIEETIRGANSQCPRKEGAIAVFLLFIGIVFGFTGLGVALSQSLYEAMPFLIIGGIGRFTRSRVEKGGYSL